jgi:hypothetical protein
MSIRDRLTDTLDWAGSRLDGVIGSARQRVPIQRRRGPWGYVLSGVLGAVAGAAATFLMDPHRGAARRARAIDQAAASARRGWHAAERTGRILSSRVSGAVEAARHAGSSPPMPNDAALADKVASELFRDPTFPKGSININAEMGIVVLRGEVPDDATRSRIEEAARGVSDVWEVRNLLHLPGEPAATAR